MMVSLRDIIIKSQRDTFIGYCGIETLNNFHKDWLDNCCTKCRARVYPLPNPRTATRAVPTICGVETKYLNRQVKCNIERFPDDFMFRLSNEEFNSLRFQIGTSKRGGARYLPFAFTEQGIAMLSSVLRSKRAIQVNIAIMRIFVKIKQILSTHKELAAKLAKLERKTENHDVKIRAIFEAISRLMEPPPEKPKKRIGFI